MMLQLKMMVKVTRPTLLYQVALLSQMAQAAQISQKTFCLQ
jgi:hypothetical protein